MSNLLDAIYHDSPYVLGTCACLDNPQSEEERRLTIQLRTMDEKTAKALQTSIEALADSQAEQSFYTGVRFGAQLMAELMKELS